MPSATRTLPNGVRWGEPWTAPRCSARCKRNAQPCRQPALRGRPTCRLHGGKGGAPSGERNGMWQHGLRSNDAIAAFARGAEAVRRMRAMAQRLD